MDIAPDPPPVPALADTAPLPADRNPALVYLASLTPGDGRRSMAALLGCPDPEACPWHELRHHHVVAPPKAPRRAIDAWLDVRGRDEGPLLTRVSQTGAVGLLPMTSQSLMARPRKRARVISRKRGAELTRSHVIWRTMYQESWGSIELVVDHRCR